ncbi:uncharacterized protein V1518DRAFT_152232 [Limtongia smithiae]|uniref:uncharacterized protein n=1 Tax=Limtongia smithiae TaxID=1125753 RepID=UPI0034CD6C2A
MDRSSPLAAMPPPAASMNIFRRTSHSHQVSLPNMPAFRDFEVAYGASFDSPTTTLAADLSQNFHIAKSPVQPTPRRSLLQSFSFGQSKVEKTPPGDLLSSPGGDPMDLSPLPHKSRPALSTSSSSSSTYSSKFSRTSSSTSTSSVSSTNENYSRLISRPAAVARQRTIGSIGLRSHPNFECAPSVTANDLDKAFSNSPDSARHLPKTVGFGLDTPTSNTSLAGGFLPATDCSSADSPLANMVSRPSHNMLRAKVRRTQSMFQRPDEFLAAEVNENKNVMAAAASKNMSPFSPQTATPGNVPLPCYFLDRQDDAFKRISSDTLINVMRGQFCQYYDRLIIVDCRFEYEFEGGHITGAVNMNSADALETALLENPPKERCLLIFHCEYSAHRAPRMATHLRSCDRHLNMNSYPELHYPDIYILDGGYSSFFSNHRSMCVPQQYVEMDASEYKEACEREMNRFRKGMRRTVTFSGTSSSSFGAQSLASHMVKSSHSFQERSSSFAAPLADIRAQQLNLPFPFK